MIHQWRHISSENDDGDIVYGQRHRAGKTMDKLGTLEVLKCDSEGWISKTDHKPDPETHARIQVVCVWHAPRSADSVGVISTKMDHLTQGYFLPDIGDGYRWEVWQPMANLPGGGQ